MRLRSSRLTAAVLGGLLAGACGPVATQQPEPPSPPPDWITVASGAGDLWVSLPTWLGPFETRGAIFANEVVAGGGQGIQLLAEGPRVAEPQPGGEGQERWLADRIEAPGAGQPAVERVRLPAGDALEIRRLDRPGTPLAWRLVAYAITTPFGTAYVLIDGPRDAWVRHEDDVARIATFIRAGPGR